jgi:hypothetical protein
MGSVLSTMLPTCTKLFSFVVFPGVFVMFTGS